MIMSPSQNIGGTCPPPVPYGSTPLKTDFDGAVWYGEEKCDHVLKAIRILFVDFRFGPAQFFTITRPSDTRDFAVYFSNL